MHIIARCARGLLNAVPMGDVCAGVTVSAMAIDSSAEPAQPQLANPTNDASEQGLCALDHEIRAASAAALAQFGCSIEHAVA